MVECFLCPFRVVLVFAWSLGGVFEAVFVCCFAVILLGLGVLWVLFFCILPSGYVVACILLCYDTVLFYL